MGIVRRAQDVNRDPQNAQQQQQQQQQATKNKQQKNEEI